MSAFYILLGNFGEWVLHGAVNNFGADIRSKKKGLVYFPVRGWQYVDGSWKDDDTLTVTGRYISCLSLNYLNLFTEGEPSYPDTITVSSTGGATERMPSVMGVYKITNITHSGRPVWQSRVRGDRYLVYNGNNMIKD